MKSLQDILSELQALATVSEDQYEAALATVVADLEAYMAGQQPPVCPTAVSAVITFSDGSTQSISNVPPPPQA